MNTQNTTASASALSYTFDNGEKVFSIDHEAIAEVLAPKAAGKIDKAVLANAIGSMLKDLVHRSSWAKGITDENADETQRLVDFLQGNATSGRFKVTEADKDKATKAMKQFAMAPEQFKAQYLKNNGAEYVDDFDTLAKRYMERRRAVKDEL
jgi:hypothetical protein